MFDLGHALGHGGLLGDQFSLCGVDLGVGLRLGALQLALGGAELGASVVVLGAGVAQLRLAVGKKLLVDGNLSAARDQLVAGVAQFALGLVALGEIFGVGLVKLGNAVVQFRLRVAHQRFKALARLRFAGGGHAVLIALDAGVVFVGIDLALRVQAEHAI